MVDTVTSQILENGPRRLVMKFTNFSDGTGEAAVTKVDATSATLGVLFQGQTFLLGTHTAVTRLWYDVSGMAVRILWDATADTDMWICRNFGDYRFTDTRAGFGGLTSPAGLVGATGSIQFTTVGASSGDSYTIIMEMTKGVPQS